MSFFGLTLVASWVVILVWPEIIAYIIGFILIWIWTQILFMKYLFSKSNNSKSNYVSFWKYKIYKD